MYVCVFGWCHDCAGECVCADGVMTMQVCVCVYVCVCVCVCRWYHDRPGEGVCVQMVP